MAASSSDYFMKTGLSTATTLSSPGYTTGDTSINVASTANLPTGTGIYIMIDEVDDDGERVSGTYNVFRGVVSSATQISSLVYEGGDPNRNYSAGATTRVYMTISSYHTNRMIDGLLVEHNQDGTHSDITATSLTVSDNVTLPTGSIGADTLDFTTFANSGQLVVKSVSKSYSSTAMIAWGGMYYDDLAMGNWPDGGFTQLIASFGMSSNRQFNVNGPEGASATSAGTVRITKPTNGLTSGSIIAVAIGIV